MPLRLNQIHLSGDLNPYGFLPGPSFVYNWYAKGGRGGTDGGRISEVTPIAPGEDIGIVDQPEIPLGSRVSEPGIIPFIGDVITSAVISEVASGPPPQPQPTDSVQTGDPDEPEFPPGSIFAPGEVWGSDNRERDFEDPPEIPIPVAGPSPVFIPVDAGVGEPDPLEPPPPGQDEEEDMPSFWDYASDVVDVFQGQAPGGGVPPAALAPPVNVPAGQGAPSGYYRNAQGALCRKRRRRRRLLTESDFNDLMRIATLPNKQNVTVALAKAVGRR